MGDEDKIVIGPNNKVRLGTVLLVGAGVLSIITAMWRFSAGITDGVQDLGGRVGRVEERLEAISSDDYTGQDHEAWAAYLAERNPDLKVPFSRDIKAGRLPRNITISLTPDPRDVTAAKRL